MEIDQEDAELARQLYDDPKENSGSIVIAGLDLARN